MRRLLQAEGCPDDVEVSVLLTDDKRIQAFNRQYRNIDRPTDVLSFSQREDGTPPCRAGGLLGDVMISVETAVRQARERGKPVDDEIDLLAGHGLLHLLGYEDETEAGAEEMRNKVAAVLGVAIAA
ncbi:MAG: rRNA maturation RNase YbeY [Armatimonadota bacterium]|nr:rRNA maturation RNase YbeY [Armatimonadota bacterium]